MIAPYEDLQSNDLIGTGLRITSFRSGNINAHSDGSVEVGSIDPKAELMLAETWDLYFTRVSES